MKASNFHDNLEVEFGNVLSLKEPIELSEFDIKIPYRCKEEERNVQNKKLWKKNISVRIDHKNNLQLEIDIVGISVPIANAIRRIILSEVPTMAIEKVFVENNTSIMQDEVLAHRLGLIPLKADPRLFEFKAFDNPTAVDTLKYELKVKCSPKSNPVPGSVNECDLYDHTTVYSGDIHWLPLENQADILTSDNVSPVDSNIIITRLRPGQEIDLYMHCHKGIGRDHAKFSPVGTAFYRLLPQITLLDTVEGEKAERLVKCFPEGVIGISDKGGRKVAYVANARNDNGNRNVFRYDDLKHLVQMSRVPDYFIFNIESTGSIQPEIILKEAVKILHQKCEFFLNELKNINF